MKRKAKLWTVVPLETLHPGSLMTARVHTARKLKTPPALLGEVLGVQSDGATRVDEKRVRS